MEELTSNANFDASDLWTAAGILLGFQVNAVRWRISREISMEAENDAIIWLPLHDYLNLASILVISIGVFALPLIGLVGLDFLRISFVVGVILLCGYVFAAFGHYKLYMHKKPRSWCPLQEAIPIIVALLMIFVFLLIYWFL